MRKIWAFLFLSLIVLPTTSNAKVCFLPGIFGGDESCLTDSDYAECRGFEQSRPCPSGQEQITCTSKGKTYYHCYCRSDTYKLDNHPEYRCKEGYTAECGCAAENLECAPEYIYKGDGLGHCADWANTDGIDACVLPNGQVFYKDCQCNSDKFPYSCRETGFKRPIDNKKKCIDPHDVELFSECDCDENGGWSENCGARNDACTEPKSSNTVGEKTCSQCEEIVCENDDLVNIEALFCGSTREVVYDCETLGYIYAPTGLCPPGTGNAGEAGVRCPFDRNFMNCEKPETCYPNKITCETANEGATCDVDPTSDGKCYKVVSCSESAGYYFDGETCQERVCPIGFSTKVTSCKGLGYTFQTNGKSGGEVCGKCICEADEGCVYTPHANDISTVVIGNRVQTPVYVGRGSLEDYCCNGYYKTCNSLCEGRDLLSDYDPNMERYDVCAACGTQYYTITKCRSGFELKNGKCIEGACDTVNGYTSTIQNESQCVSSSGLYEGAQGWVLEKQKNEEGYVVFNGDKDCNKCICSEPVMPSAGDRCRWSNTNKNKNGYLKNEDLCCNGYYSNCYADLPANATHASCSDPKIETKEYFAACEQPEVCLIYSCVNGYMTNDTQNACIIAPCPDPYTTDHQTVDTCGTGTGWVLNPKMHEKGYIVKSGELNCTKCDCNAAAACIWNNSNKGTASITDLCCNGNYATCTSNCTGYLLENLVYGQGAIVDQGVQTKTECKACNVSYWTATACKTTNGYTLRGDGRCEHTGCPVGYTSGLTTCGEGYNYEAHTNTDNGLACGRCVAKTCADYPDYNLESCPTNWSCTSASKKLGEETRTCYHQTDNCDNAHCKSGGNCNTAINECGGFNFSQIDHATMGQHCDKITGGGSTCVPGTGYTRVYKDFTCNTGWKKNAAGTACIAKTCSDYSDYNLDSCPTNWYCTSATKRLGDEDKTCYHQTDSCDDSHCKSNGNCNTSLNACVGYNYLEGGVAHGSVTGNKCEKKTLNGFNCVFANMWTDFTCNTGWKKNAAGTACVAKVCSDYDGWIAECPQGASCEQELKALGDSMTTCYKEKGCDSGHCGADCSTAVVPCAGHIASVAHATMGAECGRITRNANSTCSGPTTVYNGFTCNDGWKKNNAGTACVAKDCTDYDYVASCNSTYYSCTAHYNVKVGDSTTTCWTNNGCNSSHCGSNCQTEVNACAGYTLTANDIPTNATPNYSCNKITGGGTSTCTGPTTVYNGYSCKSGWKGTNCNTAMVCSDYTGWSDSCPGGSTCDQEYKQTGSSSTLCYKEKGCDDNHCGSDCNTSVNDCDGYPYATSSDTPGYSSPNTSGGSCIKVTGGGSKTCSTTTVYSSYTCDAGWKGTSCNTKKDCDDYTDYPLTECPTNHTCSNTQKRSGNSYKTCYKDNGCDASHCGANCGTSTNACNGYSYDSVSNATMGTSCSKVTGGGTNTCSTTTKYNGFTCNTGWKKNAAGTACVEKTCSDYSDYPLDSCPSGYACENTGKALGNQTKLCYKVVGCPSGYCGSDCSTQINPCNGYSYSSSISNATMTGPCTKVDSNCNSSTVYSGFTCNSGYHQEGNSCVANTCANNGGISYLSGNCSSVQNDCVTCTNRTVTTPSGNITCHIEITKRCSAIDDCAGSGLMLIGQTSTTCTIGGDSSCFKCKTFDLSDVQRGDYTQEVTVSDQYGHTCGTCYGKATSGPNPPTPSCSTGTYSDQSECETHVLSGETCKKVGSCYKPYCTSSTYSSLKELGIIAGYSRRTCNNTICCRMKRNAHNCTESTGTPNSGNIDGYYHYDGAYDDGCLAQRITSDVSLDGNQNSYENCVDALTAVKDDIDTWNSNCPNHTITIYWTGSSLTNNCATVIGGGSTFAACVVSSYAD